MGIAIPSVVTLCGSKSWASTLTLLGVTTFATAVGLVTGAKTATTEGHFLLLFALAAEASKGSPSRGRFLADPTLLFAKAETATRGSSGGSRANGLAGTGPELGVGRAGPSGRTVAEEGVPWDGWYGGRWWGWIGGGRGAAEAGREGREGGEGRGGKAIEDGAKGRRWGTEGGADGGRWRRRRRKEANSRWRKTAWWRMSDMAPASSSGRGTVRA